MAINAEARSTMTDYHTSRLDSLFARTRMAMTRAATIAAWQDVQKELARGCARRVAVSAVRVGCRDINARRMQNVRMDLRGELVSLALWTAGTPPASSR